jgi:myo-inositol-1(or 4)-monophosphatase
MASGVAVADPVGAAVEACAEAARVGGAVLRERWGQRRTIELKGGIDLVTDADRASEEAVLTFLGGEFPGDAILAEESGSRAGTGARRWFLDPLDGTTNYAHGVPHFAVTVALEDDQGLAAGAIFDPLRDELFLAGRGRGATLNGASIGVGRCAELKAALLVSGFPYDVHQRPERPLALFSAFIRTAQAVRRFGSAALDLAYVASGRFDGFWELGLKPWDVAAGMLIVREAGGRVTDVEGGDRSLVRGDIAAANTTLLERMLEVLRSQAANP